jgi:hypoxanthine-guanine phosphoribosyltransferase
MVSAKLKKDPIFIKIFMDLSLIFMARLHLRVSTHPNLDFFYCIQYHRGSDLASGYFIFESTMKIAIATNQPGSPKKKISTP